MEFLILLLLLIGIVAGWYKLFLLGFISIILGMIISVVLLVREVK